MAGDPMAMLQMLAGSGGGGAPSPQGPQGPVPQAPSQGAGIAQQLMQLLEPVLSSPKGQMMMAQAVQAMMGGGGGGGADPRAMLASMGAGDSQMPTPNTGGRGPTTDGDIAQVEQANQGIRGNLPPINDDGSYVDAYPSGKRPQTTEEELDMVRQMMNGAGERDRASEKKLNRNRDVNEDSTKAKRRDGGKESYDPEDD